MIPEKWCITAESGSFRKTWVKIHSEGQETASQQKTIFLPFKAEEIHSCNCKQQHNSFCPRAVYCILICCTNAKNAVPLAQVLYFISLFCTSKGHFQLRLSVCGLLSCDSENSLAAKSHDSRLKHDRASASRVL